MRDDFTFRVSSDNGGNWSLSDLEYGVSADGVTLTLDSRRNYSENGRSMCMEVSWLLPPEWVFNDIEGSWDAKSEQGEACDDDFTRLDVWAPSFVASDYGKGQVRFGAQDSLDGTTLVTLKYPNEWGQDFAPQTFSIDGDDAVLDAGTGYDKLVWEYCDDGVFNTTKNEQLLISNLELSISTVE
jgi:hypothetical protein